MFWSYLIGFTMLSVGIYFFLALMGSEVLAQLVLFLVGIAARESGMPEQKEDSGKDEL